MVYQLSFCIIRVKLVPQSLQFLEAALLYLAVSEHALNIKYQASLDAFELSAGERDISGTFWALLKTHHPKACECIQNVIRNIIYILEIYLKYSVSHVDRESWSDEFGCSKIQSVPFTTDCY